MVEFRRATYEDAVAFYGKPPEMSFKGYVAVEDGEVIGVGGVFYDELRRPIAFSQMKDAMRSRTKDKAKAVRILMTFAHSLHKRVYAVADPGEPTAPRLLKRLGFRPTGEVTRLGDLLVREET